MSYLLDSLVAFSWPTALHVVCRIHTSVVSSCESKTLSISASSADLKVVDPHKLAAWKYTCNTIVTFMSLHNTSVGEMEYYNPHTLSVPTQHSFKRFLNLAYNPTSHKVSLQIKIMTLHASDDYIHNSKISINQCSDSWTGHTFTLVWCSIGLTTVYLQPKIITYRTRYMNSWSC